MEPDDPEALANMWISLMEDRSKLHVSARGREWVAKQRDEAVPHVIREIVTSVVSEKN